MTRGDIREIGEALDEGTAGLVVIAAADVEEKVRKAFKTAAKTIRKQVKANFKELEKELELAKKEEPLALVR